MRRYYLRQRSQGGNWYAIYMNTITRKQDFTRCTGTTDKKQADSIAQDWLVNGLPDSPHAVSSKASIGRKITFCDYFRGIRDWAKLRARRASNIRWEEESSAVRQLEM